jgi:hypothetical protein
MPDPIARLEFCRSEVDRCFGQGHAAQNPDLVAAVMLSAAIDWGACVIAGALLETAPPEDPMANGAPAPSLWRPR